MQRLEQVISLIVILVVLLCLALSLYIKSIATITPVARNQSGEIIAAENKIQQAQFVDINTASRHELSRLKGIGPRLAERIIDYRNTHGVFVEKEEIMKVKGIGEKKYQAISDMVIISE